VDIEFRDPIDGGGGGAQHNIHSYRWCDNDKITGKHYQQPSTTERTYHQPCTVSCRVKMAEDVSENREWSPSTPVSPTLLSVIDE